MNSLHAHRGEILYFLDEPDRRAEPSWVYHQDGVLLIEDGYIAGCGSSADMLDQLPSDVAVIKHPNALIVPGFIDTHVHYPQYNVLAAYGTQLLEWLETYTFPEERKFADPTYARLIADQFLDELIGNGTTTALVFGTTHPQSVDAFFNASLARNLRMICGKVTMDRNAPKWLLDTPQSAVTESENLIRQWHGKQRLGYAITPRFAPTSSDAQLKAVGEMRQRHPDVHVHTHLAENARECEWVRELFPNHDNYVDVYHQYGLTGSKSVFAHGIYLQHKEWQTLADTDSVIAHCPTSNLFIGSGLFDLKTAEQYQVRLGLGTDVGGGDSFSLLRTINEAYKIQQLNGHDLSPFKSLYMATLGGARALSLDSHIGNFETGKEADFLVLDYHATPLIKRRLTAAADNLQEKLFALQMLGDDRAIRETWVMGTSMKTLR